MSLKTKTQLLKNNSLKSMKQEQYITYDNSMQSEAKAE